MEPSVRCSTLSVPPPTRSMPWRSSQSHRYSVIIYNAFCLPLFTLYWSLPSHTYSSSPSLFSLPSNMNISWFSYDFFIYILTVHNFSSCVPVVFYRLFSIKKMQYINFLPRHRCVVWTRWGRWSRRWWSNTCAATTPSSRLSSTSGRPANSF